MTGLYILVINIVTYIAFKKDKEYAMSGKRRIEERTLILLSLAGGAVGGAFAMNFYRHKTQKPKFKIVTLLGYLQFFLYCFLLITGSGLIPLKYFI